jgi:hypothetical protein
MKEFEIPFLIESWDRVVSGTHKDYLLKCMSKPPVSSW